MNFSKSDRPLSSPKPAARLRTSQASCVGTCRKWRLERLCWFSSCPWWHWPAFKGSGHNVPGPLWSDRGQAGTKAGTWPMCSPEGTWKESKDFGKPLYETYNENISLQRSIDKSGPLGWMTSGPSSAGHPSQSRANVKVRSHCPGPCHAQSLHEARLDRLKLAAWIMRQEAGWQCGCCQMRVTTDCRIPNQWLFFGEGWGIEKIHKSSVRFPTYTFSGIQLDQTTCPSR